MALLFSIQTYLEAMAVHYHPVQLVVLRSNRRQCGTVPGIGFFNFEGIAQRQIDAGSLVEFVSGADGQVIFDDRREKRIQEGVRNWICRGIEAGT